MISRVNPVYAPYGAYEMKATYQRNLLTAQAAAVLSIGLFVLIVHLWPDRRPNAADVPPIVTTVIRLSEFQQHSIQYDRPDLNPAPPPPEINRPGVIPVPVPDETFDDSQPGLIPTRDDMARMLGPGASPGGGDSVVVDTGASDLVAEPGVFVPLEFQPQLIFQYQGEYPRFARMAGAEGTTVLYVLVDELGNGIESRVARSSGIESLDEAALAWGLKCRFTPGIQNGRPVKVWVTFTYRFQLEE